MNHPKMTSIDSCWTICNEEMKNLINFELSYEVSYWKKIGYRKKKITYRKYLIEKSGEFAYPDDNSRYFFHSGFVPRIQKFLKDKNIDFDYISKIRVVEYDSPEIEGINFRDYQKEQIDKALEIGRGVIKSATGTGKSYDIMGIINAFSQEKILFLADASEILKQLKLDILKVVDANEVSDYREGQRPKRIHISTVQTFKNIVNDYKNYFDVVIIDEVDKVSTFDGMFAKALTLLTAPVKLGVTATVATDKIETRFALEGLIGPIISEYTIHQAGKDNVLSKPVIHFIKSLKMEAQALLDTRELKEQYEINHKKKMDKWMPGTPSPKRTSPGKYSIVYWNGVVRNVERNNNIATIAENIMYQGGSVLISVVNTQHGKILEEMIFGAKFIYGDTPDEERDEIKKVFSSGKCLCVIASSVWKRGISVARINCYVKAEGGKSETAVIQWAGRPLRRDDGNQTIKYEDKIIESGQVLLVDFDDSPIHHYLKKHTLTRINIYKNQGWL
jgi:superfamily II DNA or RNA helicase